MSYITKKPEKLASAIYLITSFFGDQEPLKWRLRNIASELVSLSLYLKDNFAREREHAGLELRTVAIEAITLFSVARNSGLVSDVNYEIVTKELHKYLNSLGLPVGTTEEEGRVVISPSFFNIDSQSQRLPAGEPENSQKDKISNPPNSPDSPYLPKHSNPPKKSHILKAGYLPEVNSSRTEKADKPRNLKAFGAVSVKKSSRQNVIINLLKRKKEIMIKDVSPLIKGCSEKTIQRELLAMVKSGVLKKEGEKRWSKYSLA